MSKTTTTSTHMNPAAMGYERANTSNSHSSPYKPGKNISRLLCRKQAFMILSGLMSD